MSLLTKWKHALLKRLNIFSGEDRHSKKEEKDSSPEGGQLNVSSAEEKSTEAKSTEEKRKVLSKRYVLVAGTYLVLVVLLLSLVVLRWGKMVPFLELPGMERETENILPGEDDPEDKGESPGGGEGAASTEPWLEEVEERDNLSPLPEEDQLLHERKSEDEQGEQSEGSGEITGEDEDSSSAVQAAETYLPQAASPLPEWSLHSSFNSYNREILPSGGMLHRLSRGVYFRATPGAPVAALWDGFVVKTGGEDSPYSKSVLIKHDGGYTSYYGNLREVWAVEGSFVSRGENIGLMPHDPPRAVAAVSDNVGKDNISRQVSINTIWSGYRGGDVVESWSGRIPGSGNEKQEYPGDNPAMPSLFYGESPLLYVEVRFANNSFLDPLKFIPTRN